MPTCEERVLILGTGSHLWPYLAHALALAGFSGLCYGRQPPSVLPERFVWVPPEEPLERVDRVISLLPLWLLPERLKALHGCRQLIAFGSTSSLVKEHSHDPREQALAIRLKWAESSIAFFGKQTGMAWTVLRPTMIYGAGHDRNISAIAHFIHRWRFFPVAWPGTGQRQPVHAADLASAAVACLDRSDVFNSAFNLGGGEILSYREMVKRIFLAMGRPVRILLLPAALPATAMRLAGECFGEFSPALFHRMNDDLMFDNGPAARCIGYRPRPFVPELPTHLCFRAKG
jgi:nucleoside-diphosphate-sugar epimerase